MFQVLLKHQLYVVLADLTWPCRRCRIVPCIAGSWVVNLASLVGPCREWEGKTLRFPEDLHHVEITLPGSRHTLRTQFDALCESAGIKPRIRAEVDDMAMLRLIARDSEWLDIIDLDGKKVSTLIGKDVREFIYQYDFVDNWQHRIVLENKQNAPGLAGTTMRRRRAHPSAGRCWWHPSRTRIPRKLYRSAPRTPECIDVGRG